VQQRLTDLRPEVAAQLRANRGEGAVGCDTIVVISNRQICAGGKALAVREVTHPGVIDELGDAGEWVRLRLHGILDVERSAQERVEGRSCRSTAKHRRDDTCGTGAGAACAGRSTTGAPAGGAAAYAADTTSGSSLNYTGADAAQSAAGLGAKDIGIGHGDVVACDREVEVVLQRQSDGVTHRQVHLAVANGLVDAGAIREVWRRNITRRVRVDDVEQVRLRRSVVLFHEGRVGFRPVCLGCIRQVAGLGGLRGAKAAQRENGTQQQHISADTHSKTQEAHALFSKEKYFIQTYQNSFRHQTIRNNHTNSSRILPGDAWAGSSGDWDKLVYLTSSRFFCVSRHKAMVQTPEPGFEFQNETQPQINAGL